MNERTPAEMLADAERWTVGDLLGNGTYPERATAAALVGIGRHLDTLLDLLTPDAPEDDRADRAMALVDAELTTVRGELARADAKTGVLAGLGGAALAVLTATAGTAEPWPVRVVLAVSSVALGCSVLLTGRALRPRLGRTGFCRWAEMTAEDVTRHMVAATASPLTAAAGELVMLSQIAKAKFRALRWAVDLLVVGLVLLGVAGLLGGVQ